MIRVYGVLVLTRRTVTGSALSAGTSADMIVSDGRTHPPISRQHSNLCGCAWHKQLTYAPAVAPGFTWTTNCAQHKYWTRTAAPASACALRTPVVDAEFVAVGHQTVSEVFVCPSVCPAVCLPSTITFQCLLSSVLGELPSSLIHIATNDTGACV